MPYNLGHAVFEFIEAKWGKEGIRQFLFALRKSVIGGGEDAYEEALQDEDGRVRPGVRALPEGAVQAVPRQGAAGRLRPRPGAEPREDATSREALSIAPSPSGDLIAVVTVNRKDGELDIVLLSSKDGSIVRNLTRGFDKDMGFDHIVMDPATASATTMPWMSWSPKGDRLAYFVRTEKERTLIVQNVLTTKDRGAHPDEVGRRARVAGVLARRPDGRVLGAARRHRRHLHGRSRDARRSSTSRTTTSPTTAPTYSPDGKFIVYNARVSGNQKLFRLDLDTKKKTQLTFGTHRRNGGAVHRRPHASCSRRRPPIRPCRSTRKSPRTATSTTSGRSTCGPASCGSTPTRSAATVAGRAERGPDQPASRSSPTTRASTASTRSSARSRCTRPPAPTSARPGPIIDFQAPLQHTLVKPTTSARRRRSRRCSSRAARR